MASKGPKQGCCLSSKGINIFDDDALDERIRKIRNIIIWDKCINKNNKKYIYDPSIETITLYIC